MKKTHLTGLPVPDSPSPVSNSPYPPTTPLSANEQAAHSPLGTGGAGVRIWMGPER